MWAPNCEGGFWGEHQGKRRAGNHDDAEEGETRKIWTPKEETGVDVSCLKVSVDIDVDRINMAGMTALHQVAEQRSKMMQTGENETRRREMK